MSPIRAGDAALLSISVLCPLLADRTAHTPTLGSHAAAQYDHHMPVTVLGYEQTPNPNARRYTLSAAVSNRPRSFRSAEEGASDSQAGPLFAIEGVRVVLINGDWVSVNKADGVAWSSVDRRVRETLATLEPVSDTPDST